MSSVLAAEFTEFLELELIGRLLFILGRGVIFTLAGRAIQTNDDSHNFTSFNS
jgi:hypothetical protein